MRYARPLKGQSEGDPYAAPLQRLQAPRRYRRAAVSSLPARSGVCHAVPHARAVPPLRARLREPGYFTGAMYLSYGVALLVTAPVWLAMVWFGRSLGEVLLVIGPLLIVGSPWLFRDARVLWLHLDQAFDPR
jgi:hypothetical protein